MLPESCNVTVPRPIVLKQVKLKWKIDPPILVLRDVNKTILHTITEEAVLYVKSLYLI